VTERCEACEQEQYAEDAYTIAGITNRHHALLLGQRADLEEAKKLLAEWVESNFDVTPVVTCDPSQMTLLSGWADRLRDRAGRSEALLARLRGKG
jgi:hypothetical protein